MVEFWVCLNAPFGLVPRNVTVMKLGFLPLPWLYLFQPPLSLRAGEGRPPQPGYGFSLPTLGSL